MQKQVQAIFPRSWPTCAKSSPVAHHDETRCIEMQAYSQKIVMQQVVFKETTMPSRSMAERAQPKNVICHEKHALLMRALGMKPWSLRLAVRIDKWPCTGCDMVVDSLASTANGKLRLAISNHRRLVRRCHRNSMASKECQHAWLVNSSPGQVSPRNP